MYRILFLLATIIFFVSCKSEPTTKEKSDKEIADSIQAAKDKEDEKENPKSDYDMSTVDVKDRAEFKENLKKIEKTHGTQWDFCTCIVKNDSINKAFAKPVSDSEFERLSNRFDEIETHCQAFLAQNPNQTPEERVKHEKQVKKCLKEAGIK